MKDFISLLLLLLGLGLYIGAFLIPFYTNLPSTLAAVVSMLMLTFGTVLTGTVTSNN